MAPRDGGCDCGCTKERLGSCHDDGGRLTVTNEERRPIEGAASRLSLAVPGVLAAVDPKGLAKASFAASVDGGQDTLPTALC